MPSVSDFVSSLGINTHMDATSTGYGNVSLVASSLAYLGIGMIRDHAWDVDVAAYRKLAAAGIKFDLIVDSDPAASTAAMVPIKANIIAFEGANEVDIGKVSVAAAVAAQQALYLAVKTNPLLSAIPVMNESIGDPNNYANYLPTAASSDVANMHAYAAWGDVPRYVLPERMQTETLVGKPSVITETGYFTMLNHAVDPSGVTESVQARLTLDTIFDSFSAGVSQTFLYELLDEAPDLAETNPELHYGLFHADGTPKLAATAIHDLTTIFGLPGSGTAAPVLTPGFIGMPDNASHLTLSGVNGSSFITVWAEPQVWDTAAQTEKPVTASHVTVTLGAVVGRVSVYDPTVGTAPIATYSNVSQVAVEVTDHPLIIQVSGVAAVPKPVPVPSITPAAARDASAAKAESRVVDAANGLVMSGSDTVTTSFFVDAATAPKSVITNMHIGDSVTLWGFTGNSGALVWKANQMQSGYTGATLRAPTTHGAAAITFATGTLQEVHTMLGVSTGSVNGTSYLRLTEIE